MALLFYCRHCFPPAWIPGRKRNPGTSRHKSKRTQTNPGRFAQTCTLSRGSKLPGDRHRFSLRCLLRWREKRFELSVQGGGRLFRCSAGWQIFAAPLDIKEDEKYSSFLDSGDYRSCSFTNRLFVVFIFLWETQQNKSTDSYLWAVVGTIWDYLASIHRGGPCWQDRTPKRIETGGDWVGIILIISVSILWNFCSFLTYYKPWWPQSW